MESRDTLEQIAEQMESYRQALVEISEALIGKQAPGCMDPEPGKVVALVRARMNEERATREAAEDSLRTASKRSEEMRRRLRAVESWYAVRFERLREFARDRLDEGNRDAMAAITANGKEDPAEPPTYAAQLALVRHEASSAIAALAGVREYAAHMSKAVAEVADYAKRLDVMACRGTPGKCWCGSHHGAQFDGGRFE